jgi:membrane associated rhomboid family serine protease
MIRLTPVVKNLIIINVIMFLAQVLSPSRDFAFCFGAPAGLQRDIISGFLALWDVKTECFKPYQLFTYMFLHDTGGIFHIFFNMLALAFMGPLLETYWGPKRFTIFYMVTGIGAAVFSVLMSKFFPFAHFDTMVGASGAVYGILMGFGMMFPNMEVQLMIPPIPIKAKYLVVVMFGISLIMGGNVAHFAHLGGIIFAFFMITAWRKQGGGYY